MSTIKLFLPKKSSSSVSIQLAEYFEEAISSKRFRPNQKLPTTKEVVEMFGVSTHTVRRAMNMLESKGLVNMTPRRGTFVNYNFPSPSHSNGGSNGRQTKNPKDQQVVTDNKLAGRTVGVFGLVDHDSALGDWGLFRVDSARGMLTECDRQGLILMNLPERHGMDVRQYIDMVKYYECEGVVWCRQDKLEVVSELNQIGISSVLVCRDKPSDLKCASVYPDYYEAGLRVASKINQLEIKTPQALIVHIEYPVPSHGNYARRFWAGMQAVPDDMPSLELLNKTWHIKQFREILDWIETFDKKMPVIFMCSYHLIGLLMNYKNETLDVLSDREVFAISNREPNLQLLSMGQNIVDPYIIYDDFSKLTSTGVQKLVTLMGGFLDYTNTTLEMEIARLSSFSIVSNEFFESYDNQTQKGGKH